MGLKAVFQTLGDMLFPPRCLFCDALIYPGWEICEACENDIAASPAIRRMKSGPSGDTVWCLTPFRYEGQVKESLHAVQVPGPPGIRALLWPKSCRRTSGAMEGGSFYGCNSGPSFETTAARTRVQPGGADCAGSCKMAGTALCRNAPKGEGKPGTARTLRRRAPAKCAGRDTGLVTEYGWRESPSCS